MIFLDNEPPQTPEDCDRILARLRAQPASPFRDEAISVYEQLREMMKTPASLALAELLGV